MPADLTIFAAQYLVYIDALLGAVVILFSLYRRPRADVPPWLVATALMLVLSLLFATIGGSVFNDTRPFVIDHVKPLIPHANDNGFPSDHALLAAAVVAAVGLLDIRLAIPFVVLAYLIDWARVGAGIHHVGDVVGSSLLVALATAIAALATPFIVRWLVPRLPSHWLGPPASSDRTTTTGAS